MQGCGKVAGSFKLKMKFLLVALLLSPTIVAGSIIDCCRQGEQAGRKGTNQPACVERNLDYNVVGRVSRKMCRTVFLSCCRNSAAEEYCTAGVQAAINQSPCKAGAEIGGAMKLECCDCCKQGLLAGSRGQKCVAPKAAGILCGDSYLICCNNFRVDAKNVTVEKPTKATTTEAEKNCQKLGCEHDCISNNKCKCRAGYQLKGDGKSCQDIDECAASQSPCEEGHICQNQPGSYLCMKDPNAVKEQPCEKSGFIRQNGVCVDEDECLTGTANCREKFCINAEGFYNCVDRCPYGYNAVGSICQDIDECSTGRRMCGDNYKCVNTVGYYKCQLASCQSGYELIDGKCEDVDECKTGKHNCEKNYKCKNKVGYFKCELAACGTGFYLVNGRCLDINECNVSPNICGNGRCYNDYGSYVCSCFSGYHLNTATKRCEDIDECKKSPGICESDCVNTVGSYKCVCPSGYRSIGDHCEDIDECSISRQRCPSDHVCYNEYGNYSCISTKCPNKYYILRSSYECRLLCPGNHGECSQMTVQSIKWRAAKFKKFVNPRGYKFTYVLRVSSYLRVQLHFSLSSGNENKEFFLQRRDENTVDVINIKKLVGPKRYTLKLNADVLFRGKVINKFVYFIFIFVSKYSF